jgi:hypothetical protein
MVLIVVDARAQAYTIPFQGLLTDSDGAPLPDGNYSVTFRLYASQNGGEALWTEAKLTALSSGLFATQLGDLATLEVLIFEEPYWLGVQVGGGSELEPRIPLGSTPRSIWSSNVADGAITAPKLADQAVTASKVAVGAITTTALGNGVVTQSKLAPASVSTSALANQAVATVKLADASVTSTKLGDLAVTSAKLAEGAVTSSKLANQSVTGAKISTAGATSGQVLAYTGTSVVWQAPPQFTLPFSGSSGSSGAAFIVNSTDESNFTYAVYGQTISTLGTGVYGRSNASSGQTFGVVGISASTAGVGVRGQAHASSGQTSGVYGIASSPNGNGVFGWAVGSSGSARGVQGFSSSASGRGVYGLAASSSGTNYGVYGSTNSSSGYAGFFNGRVHVTGMLSKGGGSFEIDHPLDPETRILRHSFVESPDMMNLYNGNVRLDGGGEAIVELPSYFEALNTDFRYQLTPIGAFAPLYIAETIAGNRFRIAGGTPGLEVSWQVTGIRRDAWAEANRIVVEEDKPLTEQGYFLHPTSFGRSPQQSVEAARNSGIVDEWTRLEERLRIEQARLREEQ